MATSAIVRHEMRSARAAAFVNQFRDDNSGTGDLTKDNHLYTFIGREDDPAGLKLVEGADGSFSLSGSYSSADGEWGSTLYADESGDTDEAPPAASRTILQDKRFWATAIGAKKIAPSDIHLIVPRINWTTGTTYNLRDPDSATWYDVDYENPSTNDFYVLNSQNEVWLLVAKDATATTSTVEPLLSGSLTADNTYFKDGKVAIFGTTGTGDKYVWRYLFKLTSALINTLLLEQWLPVPCTNDTLWSPDTDPERTLGRDDAYIHLGARHVIVRSELDAGPNGSGKLPSGLRYRQLALIQNPYTGATTRATGSIYYQKNSINGAVSDELVPFMGNILYLENRSPIAREDSQTEVFKTIFIF